MRHLLLICAAALLSLTACHTNKVTSATEVAAYSAQIATDSTAVSSTREHRLEAIITTADSVRVLLTADSIVTPRGTIYAPLIRLDAINPQTAATVESSVTHTDSATVGRDETTTATRKQQTDIRAETTAVYSPMTFSRVATIAGVLIATILLYIYCRKKYWV